MRASSTLARFRYHRSTRSYDGRTRQRDPPSLAAWRDALGSTKPRRSWAGGRILVRSTAPPRRSVRRPSASSPDVSMSDCLVDGVRDDVGTPRVRHPAAPPSPPLGLPLETTWCWISEAEPSHVRADQIPPPLSPCHRPARADAACGLRLHVTTPGPGDQTVATESGDH